jgi:hypothetical protein
MNEVIREREARKNFYVTTIDFDNVQTDNVVNSMNELVASSENLTMLDSVIAKNTETTLSKIIADTITSTGKGVTADSIDLAIGVANKIAKKWIADKNVSMDSIENVAGGEILGSLVALNIYSILSTSLPFAGDIADLVPISGNKDNVKFKLFSVSPMVKKGMGELADGDELTPLNVGKTMAMAERTDIQNFATDTLTYTMDVKKKDGDTDNYPMERGVNEVLIGGDYQIELNDFDVSSRETTAKRYAKTDDGVDITVTFDYDGGKITIEYSDNIADGTPQYFSASLSSEKLMEIAGVVASELIDETYVAKPVVINTNVNTLALRQVLQSTGLNLSSNDLLIALSKVAEETKRKKVYYATLFARPFGETIDIDGASETTVAERYKHFLIGVEKARADIVEKSQITSNVVLIGGSGLVDIYSALSTEPNKTNKVMDDNNTIRFLGYLNDIPCYYNPLHDEEHPVDDGKHKVFVVGNPSDPAKKAVISGVGLPVLPEDLGFDNTTTSDKIISLQGKLVVSYNKSKRAKELARELTVKLS